MAVNIRIFRRTKIATEEERFDSFEERRVSGHHVFKLAVLWASFAHNDLAVLFQNLSLEFARMRVHQSFKRSLAADHCIANFLNAARAKRICFSGESERRS